MINWPQKLLGQKVNVSVVGIGTTPNYNLAILKAAVISPFVGIFRTLSVAVLLVISFGTLILTYSLILLGSVGLDDLNT